jgi:hypothetical protein
MKKTYFLFLLTVLLVLSSSVTAQLVDTKVFRKSNVIMDATFGYALPGFDFSGSRIKDYWDMKGYGVSSGYYATFTPKVTVHNFKQGQIRTYLTVSFANFMGSENTAFSIDSLYHGIGGMVPIRWPQDTVFKAPLETIGASSIRFSAPYIAYGWEVAMYTDRERRSIFNLGMDFNFTVMWGKVYDQPYGRAENHNNIISATRLGLGFNLGYSYRMMDFLGVTFGTRMQMTNLFNKGSDVVTDIGDIPLNDEGNSTINKNMSKARSIGYFGFYTGVSFFLGGKR